MEAALTGQVFQHNHLHDDIFVQFNEHRMPEGDRYKLNRWFQDRYAYIEEHLRQAINANDSIIGKQWEFDQRPRLVAFEKLLPPR